VLSLDHQEDEIIRFVNLWWRSVAKFKRTLTSASVPAAAFSLHSQTQRFFRLPCLFIADVGVADRGANILVAEFLDFPQILSQLVEQNCGCGVALSVRGDLPHPEGSTSRADPQIERTVREQRPRISRKHKLLGCGDNQGARMRQNPARFCTS
jgi:hypothetical protein